MAFNFSIANALNDCGNRLNSKASEWNRWEACGFE